MGTGLRKIDFPNKHLNETPTQNVWARGRAFVRESLSDNEVDFTVGPIGRALGLLAVPMMLEMAMEAIFAVVDIAFVSRLGTNAIAAVGLTEALITRLWHGIEETEHKAVAFDVYVAVGGTVGERRQALVMNSYFFFKDTLRNLCIMLKHDGKLWSPREWLDGFKYLFIKPGILRRVFFSYVSFYRKDFHPWQHDNRALISEWEQDYGKSISRTST